MKEREVRGRGCSQMEENSDAKQKEKRAILRKVNEGELRQGRKRKESRDG